MILYRPVGAAEMALIAESGCKAFPPRLPEQPIFYPVLNEAYACEIAEKWNAKTENSLGYVTRFEIDDSFGTKFEVHTVGSSLHQELWVPAEELPRFNQNILGRIEVIRVFRGKGDRRELLLTYFEPFGGEKTNASAQAAALLPERIGAWSIVKCRLPVAFGPAGERCGALIDALRPDAVLMLGQAGSREAVTPELLARNVRWARIPDNAGNEPKGEPVVPGGEDALFATLPVEAMTEAIRAAGLPGALSATAGLYVCNDLYYSVLHRLRGTGIPAAFVHVPSAQTLSSERSARALEAAITALDGEKGTVE